MTDTPRYARVLFDVATASLYWPILVLATACVAIVYVTTGRKRFGRAALLVTGSVTIVMIVIAGAIYRTDAIDDWKRRLDPPRPRLLAVPMVFGTTTLPAGAEVMDPPDDYVGSYHVRSAREIVIGGVPVRGSFELDHRGNLTGAIQLGRDARIDGVTCDANTPTTLDRGRLAMCRLAAPYRDAGIDFEPGTVLDVLGTSYHFTIGQTPPTLRIAGSSLPFRATVIVDPDSISVEQPFERGGLTRRCLRLSGAHDGRSARASGDVPGCVQPNAARMTF